MEEVDSEREVVREFEVFCCFFLVMGSFGEIRFLGKVRVIEG